MEAMLNLFKNIFLLVDAAERDRQSLLVLKVKKR